MKRLILFVSVTALFTLQCSASEIVNEGKQEAGCMQDVRDAGAADLKTTQSSYTGKALKEFHWWSQLPIEIKRKVMEYVRANSDMSRKVLSWIPVPSRKLRRHGGPVTSVALKGERVVSGSEDKTMIEGDLQSGDEQQFYHPGIVSSVAVASNRVISGSRNTVYIWGLPSGLKAYLLASVVVKGTVNFVAVAGNQVVSGSDDGRVRICDLLSGTEQHVLWGHDCPIRSVAVDSDRVISGSRALRIWDLLSGEQEQVWWVPDWVTSVAAEGNQVVSGSRDKTVRVWDLPSGTQQRELRGHDGPVNSVAVEGNRVVSGSRDKTVRVWDLSKLSAVDAWLKAGCPTNMVQFKNQKQETCEIPADPLEVDMLLQEFADAAQDKKKLALSKKQQAYFNAFPPEVQDALQDKVESLGE